MGFPHVKTNKLRVTFGMVSPQRAMRMNRFRARIRSKSMRYIMKRYADNGKYNATFEDYLFLAEHGYPKNSLE